MSIGRAQAAALAESFLETTGTDDKGDLQIRETITELFLICGELVEDAQQNLNGTNSNASGNLSASLIVSDPVQMGAIVKADILMNFYGQFVNKGVRGTKSGSSTAGYSFKTPYPNKKMADVLVAGISRAKASTSNTNRNKSVSKNEIKNATISDIDKAYGAARNIKMYGIKPTGFMDKAITSAEKKLEERLGAAFKTDIINSLPDGDNNSVNTGNV